MTLEVEQKFHVDDRQALERKLKEIGATKTGSMEQHDIYLVHPSRDLPSTDEAFRIRYDSKETLICYKGPKQPGKVKIREEIEVPVPDGHIGDLRKMLSHLGFGERATVNKHRETWQVLISGTSIGPITVALDSVENVGEFAEVELVVEEHQADEASQQISTLASRLGLTNREQRSYIALLLANIG